MISRNSSSFEANPRANLIDRSLAPICSFNARLASFNEGTKSLLPALPSSENEELQAVLTKENSVPHSVPHSLGLGLGLQSPAASLDCTNTV
jgi:hypothetical protein